MAARVRVKICGVRSAADISSAVTAGAAYVGFNFFPRSPRYLEREEAAALAESCGTDLIRVGLTVDADDDALATLVSSVPLDWLQLHGTEDPRRVAEVRARFGLPVMKALGVGDAADLDAIDRFSEVADQLLIDARPPKDAVLPGGNGLSFDWQLLVGRDWSLPWMLAGGLTPDNVAEAVRLTGAQQVDVSSGVESAPGVKDAMRIAAFVAAAQV